MSEAQSLLTTRTFGRICSAATIAACQFPSRSSKLPASSSASCNSRPLSAAHLGERRVADDAAAQLGGRHLAGRRPSGALGGRCRIETPIAPPVKLGCAWTVLGGQQNAAKSKLTFARAPFKNVATLICRSVVPLPA